MNPKQKFIIAVIITLTICLTIGFAFINTVVNGVEMSEQGRNILGNTISALLAIVSMIIGNNILKDK